MPPLKGIDRGLNGDALKALEESGHGQRIAIVDPSYAIPEGAKVIAYQGDSSATALRGILSLLPTEKIHNAYDALVMAADENPEECEATKAFERVAKELGLELGYQDRLGVEGSQLFTGFYTEVNEPETLFIRTRDELAFACATFIVGHSQVINTGSVENVLNGNEVEDDKTHYADFAEMRRFVEQNKLSAPALGHLWSELVRYTGVDPWPSQEVSAEKVGKIEIDGEMLELIHVGEGYSDEYRALMIDKTLGLRMNLETLRKSLDAGLIASLKNVGPKALLLVERFLDSQGIEGSITNR